MSLADCVGELVRAPQRRRMVWACVLTAVAGHAAIAQDNAAPPEPGDNPEPVEESVAAANVPIEELLSSNLLELRENADLVFVGELIDSELISGRDGGVLRTRYEFAVETFLKGERADDRISLRNLGGRSAVTGKTMSTPFSFEFTVGERYLVFLRPGFEELALPIIHAFSIEEGGDVLVDPSGRRLVGLSQVGQMVLASEADYAALNYGPDRAIGAPPAPAAAPAPSPGSGEVRINPAATPSATLESARGVTLEDVEQVLR
ncbi:MAG: hypothetical protein ACREIR_08675 [Geminicoccaceae bacterium]